VFAVEFGQAFGQFLRETSQSRNSTLDTRNSPKVAIGRDTNSLMMMVTPRIIIQEEEEERLGIAAP